MTVTESGKWCEICGMNVDGQSDIQRFGKHFCSQAHADQYVQEVQRSRQGPSSSGGSGSSGGCC